MLTVYSTSTCSVCVTVKRFLKLKNIEYQEVLVDDMPELRQRLIDKTGYSMVPVITDGEKYVSGYQPAQLLSMV